MEDREESSDGEVEFDPINDIIDYLVRCKKITFKPSHIDGVEVKSKENAAVALNIFKDSPLHFLRQFGKHLAPQHILYFENLVDKGPNQTMFHECVKDLKVYHSTESKHKRIRNRRYKALQKLQEDSDYFSDKQMMYRNPLLYDQLVGQYLTEEEIRERDGTDRENLTLLNLILETVDCNEMRQRKDQEVFEEEHMEDSEADSSASDSECTDRPNKSTKWGDFETPDPKPSYKPEIRKQSMISAPERRLLREEFLQEMYNSFLNGQDVEIDYADIDNNEQYDDIEQINQDAEDKYFDSETTDVENLEEHMKLVEVYGTKKKENKNNIEDTLDTYMTHLNKRLSSS